MKREYLKHISGLKGMGALIVFIYHFLYCFYPLFIPEGTNAAPIEHIPVLNILVNGNFAVCVFILLSGYLMAGSAERLDSLDAYGNAIVRRYVRLMIPLAVAASLSYLLCISGLYRIREVSEAIGNELTSNYFRIIHFHHLPISFLWAPFGYHVLVGPFWMMKYILVGSFVVMGVTLAIRRYSPIMQILGILFTLTLALYLDALYACVLSGMLLYKVGQHPIPLKGIVRIPAILLMLAAAFWLSVAQDNMMDYDKYKNILASFLFVSAVLLSKSLLAFFSSRLMDTLGKLSLGVFIFHWPVICSLSCRLFLEWPIQNQWILFGSIFIISLSVSLSLAHLYNKWVAPWSDSLLKRIG